ncbi:hypothetical protein QL285_086406 [Trifolium repens]|nr:hypothetical protein QL285_086406 [Trifolium repens]
MLLLLLLLLIFCLLLHVLTTSATQHTHPSFSFSRRSPSRNWRFVLQESGGFDVLTKEVAEVNEFKAKVAEFDAMKEQFAVIMANMQNHGSNIRSPFEVRRSSESSHNVEGDQATPDD